MATTRRGIAILLVLMVMSALLPAWAVQDQEKPTVGLIFGTVYGPNNRPVYGVKIKIRRADQKKAKWELMSDHHGEFAQRVPAGDYVVWPDIKMPKGQAPEEVKIHVENGAQSELSLHLTE